MQLTPGTQHALVSLSLLAARQGDSTVKTSPRLTVAEIACRTRISVSYLEQLFRKLRIAGLVVGRRGKDGGYRLTQPASAVTLADIARAVSPEASASTRLPDQRQLDALTDRLGHFLDHTTLAQIL